MAATQYVSNPDSCAEARFAEKSLHGLFFVRKCLERPFEFLEEQVHFLRLFLPDTTRLRIHFDIAELSGNGFDTRCFFYSNGASRLFICQLLIFITECSQVFCTMKLPNKIADGIGKRYPLNLSNLFDGVISCERQL
jgi:hypothetical protein